MIFIFSEDFDSNIMVITNGHKRVDEMNLEKYGSSYVLGKEELETKKKLPNTTFVFYSLNNQRMKKHHFGENPPYHLLG